MFSEFRSLIFYIGVFCGSAYLLGFISQTQKKKTIFYTIITFAALMLPILVATFRSSGTDTFAYMRSYVSICRASFEDVLDNISGFSESGHALLTKLLGYFKNVRVYFGVYAAITVLVFYFATRYFKKSSVALVMLLFYFGTFVSSFNIMRQCIAVVLIAYAYKYVFEKDLPRFLILIFVASTFHLSAFLAIFTYFIWSREGKLIPGVFLLIIFIIVTVVSFNLDTFLGNFADYEFESDSLNRYVGYNSNEVEAKNRDFYLTLLIAVILMLHYNRLIKIDSRNSFFIYLFFISTAMGLCGFINPYAKRIAMYFSVGSHWLLADIPKCYEDDFSKRLAVVLVVFYAIARFTLTAYILGQGGHIPYIWILPYWAKFN